MADQCATTDIDMACEGITIDSDQDITHMDEDKRTPYTATHSVEYMGVGIDEWLTVVNNSVSFKVNKIGNYTRSLYASAIDATMIYLTRNECSFKEDISMFMRGGLDSEGYVDALHTRLTSNYIMYKNYCLRHGLRAKAVSSYRDDWYTTCVEFIDDDIKCQYMEIIHSILTNVSNLMMCSCMQNMTI